MKNRFVSVDGGWRRKFFIALYRFTTVSSSWLLWFVVRNGGGWLPRQASGDPSTYTGGATEDVDEVG